jgi:tRNA(Ile2) C34 agmatinyltransferase TiaS
LFKRFLIGWEQCSFEEIQYRKKKYSAEKRKYSAKIFLARKKPLPVHFLMLFYKAF